MRRFLYVVIFLLLVIGGMLGYGYWHAYTHSFFQAYIYLDDRDNFDGQALFLNAKGEELAKGTVIGKYHYIKILHPELGDCNDIGDGNYSELAKITRDECFKKYTAWISSWAGNVSSVSLNIEDCIIHKKQIITSRRNNGWYLWWFPSVHVFGKPYSYYISQIKVQRKECR